MEYEQKQKDFDWLMDRIKKYQGKLPKEKMQEMLKTRDKLMTYLFKKKSKALEDNSLFYP